MRSKGPIRRGPGEGDRAPRDVLRERRDVWGRKELLRRLYGRWYERLGRWMRPGCTLELGGGSGQLKHRFPKALSTDVVYEPWLDAVLDAHRLPFRAGRFENVVLFDVLHHLVTPVLFFEEALRVLRPEGRILLMEPFVSPLSYPVYRFLHHEGLCTRTNPLAPTGREGKEPLEGNQALPGLLFGRYRSDFFKGFPSLRILREEKTDFFLYPLSGGFHHPSLCPLFLYPFLRVLEDLLSPLAGCLAFRLFVVLEKR